MTGQVRAGPGRSGHGLGRHRRGKPHPRTRDFTIPIGPLCFPTDLCYIIVNPGIDVNHSLSTQRSALVDVDGDGLPDAVSSTTDDKLVVSANTTGRTNLLQSVRNSLGGTITVDYTRRGNTTA